MSRELPSAIEAALAALPEFLRGKVAADAQQLALALKQPQAGAWLESLPRVFAASDFVAQNCVQFPEMLLELVASGALEAAHTEAVLRARVITQLAGCADELALKTALRAARRREMVRIAWRDLAGWADLPETIAALSELADACIDGALSKLHGWALQKYGEPAGEGSAQPQRLVVLGMGKLGGGELNFSSDIDLIFAYPEEGNTAGPRTLSNHEFFVRLGQSLIGVLSESTGDGFVFRVDMRLRPNGASGPLALSFDAMEHYYQTHGRDWERYAFIKARCVGGDCAAGAELLARLKPFVFRKYLDYNAIEAIRSMKLMIEREIARKGMSQNIKLGRGGIREVEFIAQAMQLIRAGREPKLQDRRALAVLAELGARGYLDPSLARELGDAYVFLRNTEHRLQMFADQQTQLLPQDEIGQARLAFASSFDDWATFSAALDAHRERVHAQFSILFMQPAGEEKADPLQAVWQAVGEGESALRLLAELGYQQPTETSALLKGLREGASYAALSAEGRARLDRLVPLLLRTCARSADPQVALQRLVQLLEAIGRRTTYLALMVENPPVLDQVVRLAGASPWIAGWIAAHPIVLDELIDPRALTELPTREQLADELRQRLAHIPEDDLELQMEVLREFRHGHVLRVAAADVGLGVPAEQVGRHLAEIAEVLISESLAIAQRDLVVRHGRPAGRDPEFAVIGYGKLGSFELGYSSDLDIIFIYDAPPDSATDGPRPLSSEQFYARLGQRLIHILTVRTPGGTLYEVDMRLRPSGKSGPLVASVLAFRHYQLDQAWTWEHQALVRARPLAGSPSVRAAFARVRNEVLCRARDAAKLAAEVREMRAKMLETHGSGEAGLTDLKHDRGGIVDIEFMVQYAVLRWAREHPALTSYTDNIHLLQQLGREGLFGAAAVETLTEAYRRYLSVEHHLKLMERGSLVDPAELGDLPGQVRQVWREILNEE